jgi:hypothetical protein
MPWTQSLPGAMMPLHSCSGTVCGARRRCELPRWDRCRACLAISARCYHDNRSPCQVLASESWSKLQPKFRELEDRGTVCGAAIRIAVASIKMSVRWAALTMRAKLTNSLPHSAAPEAPRPKLCRVVRSQVRLSAPRRRSVKPGPSGHRRWRLAGLTDRWRRAARSAHAINAGMSMTAPMTGAVIVRSAAP